MFTKVNLELTSSKHLIDQNMMIKTLNLEGKTTEISSAFCRYTGYLQEELIRQKNNFFLAEDNQALATRIWRSIQTGHAWEGEYVLQSAEGENKWVSAVIEPILDVDYTSKKLTILTVKTRSFFYLSLLYHEMQQPVCWRSVSMLEWCIKNSMTTQYKITFSFSVMIFLLVLGSGVAIFNVLKLSLLYHEMQQPVCWRSVSMLEWCH
jgi:PAS domain S-box-containing protein